MKGALSPPTGDPWDLSQLCWTHIPPEQHKGCVKNMGKGMLCGESGQERLYPAGFLPGRAQSRLPLQQHRFWGGLAGAAPTGATGGLCWEQPFLHFSSSAGKEWDFSWKSTQKYPFLCWGRPGGCLAGSAAVLGRGIEHLGRIFPSPSAPGLFSTALAWNWRPPLTG